MRWLAQIRLVARSLARERLMTLVAVGTLALAIGANTTIFSFLDSILLQPLDYADPGRLVSIAVTEGRRSWRPEDVSPADFADWRRQATSFEEMGAFRYWGLTLTGSGEPEDFATILVTPNLLPLLGSQPPVGRGFRREEATEGRDRVVLLSHSLWQRRFGGDRGIVGEVLTLDGEGYEVVGVMPPEFDFPHDGVDLWAPLVVDPEISRSSRFLQVVARLDEGVDLRRAETEMEAIAQRLAASHPDTNDGLGVVVETLHERMVGHVRPILSMLLAVVFAVLLIACSNVATLLTARSARRRSELAVRVALGAGRRRLLGDQLLEALVLGLTGGIIGLGVGWLGMEALVRIAPPETPRLEQVALSPAVLGFSFAITILAALLFGILPALQAIRVDAKNNLEQGAGGGSSSPARQRVRRGLVVVQTALTLVLLVTSGLTLRTLLHLQDVDPGFHTENLLVVQLFLTDTKYPQDSQRREFGHTLSDRLARLGGVTSVGATSALPMSRLGAGSERPFSVVGRSIDARDEEWRVAVRVVTPGYFRTMGIPLLRGRAPEAAGRPDGPRRIWVNQALVERFWPQGDPLAARVELGDVEEELEIAGIVGDTRHYGLDDQPAPEVYLPFDQYPVAGLSFVSRTSMDPAGLLDEARSAVYAIDPDQPVHRVSTMESMVAETLTDRRLTLALLSAFAVLALVLASGGLYGVMSYGVAQRQKEIGIRMSMGAGPGVILRLILKQGLSTLAVGALLGLLGAMAASRLLASMLYGIETTDPVTYAGATLLLVAVGLLATYLPARRAASVDPMRTIRT